MHSIRRHMTGFAAGAATLMMLSGALIAGGSAVSAHGDEAHPAHIHVGDCSAPGEVVFPLSNVSSAMENNGTPTAGGEMVGQMSAVPVDASVTTVGAALADIVGGGHAIVVHESAENIGNYIACGDIGGVMMGASDLAIGLAPLNDSGYSGVALLHDNGDGSTNVSVFLTEAAGADEGGEASAGANAIDIKDFAYSVPTLEVAVGTTVTWTNLDSTAHTVSQVGGGFESGKMETGATFSFTFDTPGTYEYFCQYHPNMKATIVVK